MKLTTSFFGLALALANAAGPPGTPFPFKFYSIALATGHVNVHLLPLNARGGYIYVGGTSKQYCPPDVASQGACPHENNGTAYFVITAAGTAAMAVEVPGGQDLFVGEKGALRYTEPHTEGSFPAGSFTKTFNVGMRTSPGQPHLWNFTGGGATDGEFYACGPDNQVFLDTECSDVSGCIFFEGLAPMSDATGPWEYL